MATPITPASTPLLPPPAPPISRKTPALLQALGSKLAPQTTLWMMLLGALCLLLLLLLLAGLTRPRAPRLRLCLPASPRPAALWVLALVAHPTPPTWVSC